MFNMNYLLVGAQVLGIIAMVYGLFHLCRYQKFLRKEYIRIAEKLSALEKKPLNYWAAEITCDCGKNITHRIATLEEDKLNIVCLCGKRYIVQKKNAKQKEKR